MREAAETLKAIVDALIERGVTTKTVKSILVMLDLFGIRFR